jgi:hypothetical protein
MPQGSNIKMFYILKFLIIEILKKCLIKSIIHNETNIIKWLFNPKKYKFNNNDGTAELIYHIIINDSIELLKLLCKNEFISKYILENDSFMEHIASVEMINFFLKKKEALRAKKFDIDKNIFHYLMKNNVDSNKVFATSQIIISMLNVQYCS